METDQCPFIIKVPIRETARNNEELYMRQAHQALTFRRGSMCNLSLLLGWGIGLALEIGILTSPEAWALNVSSTAVTFQAVQGAINPPSQTVNVSKSNRHPANWVVTDNAAWLAVSPGAGSMTSTVQISVTVNTAGLGAGTYTATVTITLDKGGSASVPVTLTVIPATTSSSPTTATVSWSPATNVAGYNVHVGTASGVYGPPIDVGNVTSYAVLNLTLGNTYYFAVSDYTSSGVESLLSNEVSKSIY
jgi:hypothetical protein